MNSNAIMSARAAVQAPGRIPQQRRGSSAPTDLRARLAARRDTVLELAEALQEHSLTAALLVAHAA
jgi:hypothetical protein